MSVHYHSDVNLKEYGFSSDEEGLIENNFFSSPLKSSKMDSGRHVSPKLSPRYLLNQSGQGSPARYNQIGGSSFFQSRRHSNQDLREDDSDDDDDDDDVILDSVSISEFEIKSSNQGPGKGKGHMMGVKGRKPKVKDQWKQSERVLRDTMKWLARMRRWKFIVVGCVLGLLCGLVFRGGSGYVGDLYLRWFPTGKCVFYVGSGGM